MSDEAMEERLAAALEERQAWQVYGDWLLERGDAWGEVIAGACAGRDEPRRRAEVEALAEGIDGLELTWGFGVIRRLSLCPEEEGPDMGAVLAALLRHPAGRHVQELVLGLPVPSEGDVRWNFDGPLTAIAEAGRLPFLRVLDLTQDAAHMDQDSWRRLGDLEPVWPVAPRLEVLRAKGSAGSDDDGPQLKLGAIDAPRLRHLELQSSGLHHSAPEDIGRASLPALRHLELWFGREDYGCSATVESLAGILSGRGLPSLATLALRNSEWEVDFLEAVLASPVIARLTALDLSMGILCRDGAAVLARHAARLRHLARLDVSENYLFPDDVSRLAALIPGLVADEQREPEGDPDDDYSRYCAVGE